MKKIFVLALCLFLALVPMIGTAETAMQEGEAEFFTWAGMGTLAGAVAAVLLIVQYIKAPLDKVWKIPTRVLVYMIAFVLLTAGEVVNGTISLENMGLVILNAFMVATSAMGTYEMTFKKVEAEDLQPPDEE